MKRPRMMAVLDPVKVVIDNYPEGQTEYVEVVNNLENESLGVREVPFSREIYIEREDFMEEPPKKYFRMFPGNEVRLMNAYFVTCNSFVKDEDGRVTEIHCTYDPASRGGKQSRRTKGKGARFTGIRGMQRGRPCVCMRISWMRRRVYTMRTEV